MNWLTNKLKLFIYCEIYAVVVCGIIVLAFSLDLSFKNFVIFVEYLTIMLFMWFPIAKNYLD